MQGVLSGLFTAASQVLRTVSGLYKVPHECTLSKDLHIRVPEIQFFPELSLQLPCSQRVVRARVDLLYLSIILQILPFPKSCRIHPFFEDDEGDLQLLLPFRSFSLPAPCSCPTPMKKSSSWLVFLSTPFSHHHLEEWRCPSTYLIPNLPGFGNHHLHSRILRQPRPRYWQHGTIILVTASMWGVIMQETLYSVPRRPHYLT